MDRGHGSCAVDSSIPRPIDEHRLDLLIALAPLGQPGRPQRPTTSRWLERPSGGRRGTRSRRSVPPHPPTWQLLGDELSQPRLELIVGWPSREYSRRDHGLGMSAGRDAKQEIGEALGMQPAPDHLDCLEAVESADHIAQEAPRLLVVPLLRPVARHAPAAGRSGGSASDGSDRTPPGRHRAGKVLHDGLAAPADDDGVICPHPDEADQLRVTRRLALPILEGCHASIVSCRASEDDRQPDDG